MSHLTSAWPLIGHYWSRDNNTSLSLAEIPGPKHVGGDQTKRTSAIKIFSLLVQSSIICIELTLHHHHHTFCLLIGQYNGALWLVSLDTISAHQPGLSCILMGSNDLVKTQGVRGVPWSWCRTWPLLHLSPSRLHRVNRHRVTREREKCVDNNLLKCQPLIASGKFNLLLQEWPLLFRGLLPVPRFIFVLRCGINVVVFS